MVELSLKTRGQGRGGGANEFGRRAPAIVRCARSDRRRFAAAPGAGSRRGAVSGRMRGRGCTISIGMGKSLACRLPLAACRLSLIACRSSRDAGRATLASGSGETHDRASCAARGHARGHTGIPACPRPPQRFPPREKRANPPIFVMSPCEARNKTRAAFVFIHMGRRPPRRARDARPPDRCAARRRKWNRYGCFQPHARCSR